ASARCPCSRGPPLQPFSASQFGVMLWNHSNQSLAAEPGQPHIGSNDDVEPRGSSIAPRRAKALAGGGRPRDQQATPDERAPSVFVVVFVCAGRNSTVSRLRHRTRRYSAGRASAALKPTAAAAASASDTSTS